MKKSILVISILLFSTVNLFAEKGLGEIHLQNLSHRYQSSRPMWAWTLMGTGLSTIYYGTSHQDVHGEKTSGILMQTGATFIVAGALTLFSQSSVEEAYNNYMKNYQDESLAVRDSFAAAAIKQLAADAFRNRLLEAVTYMFMGGYSVFTIIDGDSNTTLPLMVPIFCSTQFLAKLFIPSEYEQAEKTYENHKKNMDYRTSMPTLSTDGLTIKLAWRHQL